MKTTLNMQYIFYMHVQNLHYNF